LLRDRENLSCLVEQGISNSDGSRIPHYRAEGSKVIGGRVY
jgi:hypothetical protein